MKQLDSTLLFVEVPSQLADKLSVSFVVGFGLQRLVLNEKVGSFATGFLFKVSYLSFELMSLSIQLRFKYLALALTLIEMFTQSVYLLLLRIQVDPVPLIDILLDFHPQYVRVNRHTNLVGQRFNLSLFLLNGSSHVVEPLLG